MMTQDLTLLFLIRKDEILLAMKKRGFGAGRWNGVGGKVESDESLEQALIRECQEEIEVTPITFGKVADIIFNEVHEDRRKLMHVSAFTCTEWRGKPVETEEMRPQWFKKNTIPYDDCWSDDRHWLPLVLAGKKVKAQFTMDSHDQVTEHTVTEVEQFDET